VRHRPPLDATLSRKPPRPKVWSTNSGSNGTGKIGNSARKPVAMRNAFTLSSIGVFTGLDAGQTFRVIRPATMLSLANAHFYGE
jgi:hypothetical protein